MARLTAEFQSAILARHEGSKSEAGDGSREEGAERSASPKSRTYLNL